MGNPAEPTRPAHSAVETAPVIDAAIPAPRARGRRLVPLAIVTIVFSGALIAMLVIGSPVGAVGVAVAMVLTFISLYSLRTRRVDRLIRRAFPTDDTPLPPTAEVLETLRQLLDRYWQAGPPTAPLRNRIGALVQASAGHNCTARLAYHPEWLPPLPAPLTVPFEPTPLQERAASFQELLGDTVGPAAPSWWELDHRSARKRWRRWLHRVVLLIGALLILASLVQIASALLSGRTPQMVYNIVGAGGSMLLTAYLRAILATRYFLVPAGLLAVPGAMSRGETELYTRKNSTLLCWYDSSLVTLLRSDGQFVEHVLTPAEMDGLWRAWLSPLPAPDLSRASDFLV